MYNPPLSLEQFAILSQSSFGAQAAPAAKFMLLHQR